MYLTTIEFDIILSVKCGGGIKLEDCSKTDARPWHIDGLLFTQVSDFGHV